MENKLNEKHPYLNRRRRSIVRDFFRSTSIHGLPAIVRGYTPKHIVFWSLAFLLFFGMMMYFVIVSILAYFTYPTQTNVDIVVEYPMDFPAVSICNYGAIRYDLFIQPFVNFLYTFGVIGSNSSSAVDFSSPIMSFLINQFVLYSLDTLDTYNNYLYAIDELLYSCTYNGVPCNGSDFVMFVSSTYGFCYTFNAKRNSTDSQTQVRSSADNGEQGVLQLELFTYDYLNIPYFRDGVGIITLLHDNTQVPQIDIDGMAFAPNRQHSLTFSKTTISFLSAPYTNCTETMRADMKAMLNANYIGAQYQYSRQICLNLCTQTYTYSICNCTSPTLFNTRNILLPNGQVILAPVCLVADTCYQNATDKFMNNLTLNQQYCSHCTSECQLTSFDVQLSSILAPALYKQMAVKQWLVNNSLKNDSRAIALPTDWVNNSNNYVQQNYVGLQVVLGTNLISSYRQSASLNWADVISNVGGQTGLWIGVSMLSVIELFEMIYRLLRGFISRRCHKK